MTEQKNTKVVQDAYAAFQRTDIPAIINSLTDDIDWQVLGPPELPIAGVRKGKPEVNRFFKQVAELWNFERFDPRQFIEQGDIVVVLGYYGGTAKESGRKFAAEWAHVFTVKNGRIAKFREYTDTANLIGALNLAAART